MKLLAATLAVCSLAAVAEAQQRNSTRVAPPDMQAITPPLATYTDEILFGDVWKRTELGPRDRSLRSGFVFDRGRRPALASSLRHERNGERCAAVAP